MIDYEKEQQAANLRHARRLEDASSFHACKQRLQDVLDKHGVDADEWHNWTINRTWMTNAVRRAVNEFLVLEAVAETSQLFMARALKYRGHSTANIKHMVHHRMKIYREQGLEAAIEFGTTGKEAP